ncbi:hypothetical protein C2E23DRAFT_813906 [Lenzites betulinus]|nr:hypothetical protein C2E23DRAFT_813906 [Lenzites betulinus]
MSASPRCLENPRGLAGGIGYRRRQAWPCWPRGPRATTGSWTVRPRGQIRSGESHGALAVCSGVETVGMRTWVWSVEGFAWRVFDGMGLLVGGAPSWAGIARGFLDRV